MSPVPIPSGVGALATRIKAAQGPEIETMTAWLREWNEPIPTAGSMQGHDMEGMMSAEDMARLNAAQGEEAAKLFLTQMIAHHEGAIVMARTEADNGNDEEAVAMAKAIISAQEAEIQEMKSILAGS